MSLDFETYSEVDLKQCGVGPYSAHHSFEVLMTAFALDNGPVCWWKGFPEALMRSLARCEDLVWHAYNAPFEMAVMASRGVHVPLERWRCTMAHAYSRGFAGTLAEVGAQVGLGAGEEKLDTGTRLIARFCKPAPRNHLTRRYTPENDPENWAAFREYNIRDVIAERSVAKYLSRWPMTEEELGLWRLDQRINARGVPVDVEMASRAIETAERWSKRYDDEIRSLTGGIGGRRVAALLEWARENGYTGFDLRAGTVDDFLRGKVL